LVGDEEARSAAREILAQPEFTRWDEDFDTWLRFFDLLADLIPAGWIDALNWLEKVLIEDLLSGFVRGLAEFLGLFGVFGDSPAALGWLAVCLLLSAAIALVYRVWGANRFEARSSDESRRPGRNHSESIRKAKALAREGHYLEAAHRVQLATLAMLIDFDWLELARSDPNRTLRRRVEDSALPESERRKLIALVDRLESLWFNEPREDRELFEEWIALDERLLRVTTGGDG
jgi:hypothetical protein